MEIRQFAEIILYGKDLTREKLLHPGELTDDFPGQAVLTPSSPGRPSGLDFVSEYQTKKIFPNLNALEKEHERAVMLHFFANHELLAMELMALALLRFPDAPSAFRLGIARTIMEEQRHMTLYISRMNELGLEFGSISVNQFFWKCLSDMKSPLDYVVKMSMTFEQANLDFACFYREKMHKIGDKETASILDSVYEDEIGHVKHGVVWFEKWRDQSVSSWNFYCQNLQFPLSPARAKGVIFDSEARVKAGLDNVFIEQLSVYSASKGRPPNLYWFNPCCELEVQRGKKGFHPVKAIKELEEDCATLCQFLAAKDDIVLSPYKPSIEFLRSLQKVGYDLPQWHIVHGRSLKLKEFEQNLFGMAKPWGKSPESEHFFAPLATRIKAQNTISYDHEVMDELYSKSFTSYLNKKIYENFYDYRDFFSDPQHLHLISDITEVINIGRNILCDHEKFVVKLPFGSAGQNAKRFSSVEFSESEENWLKNNLFNNAVAIIEPWYKRCVDISAQIKVQKNQVIYMGETIFLTNDHGQYLGTCLGRKTNFLSQDELAFLYQKTNNTKPIAELLKEVSLFIGETLKEKGYEGPCGIDTFIYKDPFSKYGYRFKLVSEINPRYTMGRVALEISKRIVPGTPALWIHLRVKDVIKKYGAVSSFVTYIHDKFPAEVVCSPKPLLNNGVLFTNDPEFAKNTLTILFVGAGVLKTISESLAFLNLDLLLKNKGNIKT